VTKRPEKIQRIFLNGRLARSKRRVKPRCAEFFTPTEAPVKTKRTKMLIVISSVNANEFPVIYLDTTFAKVMIHIMAELNIIKLFSTIESNFDIISHPIFYLRILFL
jgi:hypothetical protein